MRRKMKLHEAAGQQQINVFLRNIKDKIAAGHRDYKKGMDRLNKELQAKMTGIGGTMSQLQGDKDAADERVQQLQSDVASLRQEIEQKNKDIQAAQDSVESLRSKIAGMVSAADQEAVNAQLDDVRQRLAGVQSELEDANQRAVQLEKQMEEMRQQHAAAAAQAKQDSDEMFGTLLDALDAAEKEAQGLRQDAEKLDGERRAALEDLNSLREKLKIDKEAPAADVQADHTNHYGTFNLMEHLNRHGQNSKWRDW